MHPQAEVAVALWAQGPQVTDPGFGPAEIATVRAQARRLAAREPREPVTEVEDVDADGVACRLYRPTAAGGPCILFAHGGGFVFGDLDTHDAQCRRLANRTGLAVLAVDYRRPPEHPFPAAPDDVDAALCWLHRNGAARGLDADRVVALGDSAGANLALVAALRRPDAVVATVLVYPFLDPTGHLYAPGRENGGLTAGEAAWYWEQYAAADEDRAHPDLAPLRSERLAVLPPTLLVVAGEDLLLGEDLELGRLLREAGVAVTVAEYDGMVHGFWRHPALFDAAEESLAEIADFLRRTV